MASYIIRLDDACETMNHSNWNRIESLLDRYDIKPLVGVIPDNKDEDFKWDRDLKFWNKVLKWQEKGWTIALHGLNHRMYKCKDKKIYYQKSHGEKTEWAGRNFDEQLRMISRGLEIFNQHGIDTAFFFAPAHTYDSNTVKACLMSKKIKYISDGYNLKPFIKDGIIFIPSICDGPFAMKGNGVYTFVLHPSVMTEERFQRLETFISYNHRNIISIQEITKMSNITKQNFVGYVLERIIYFTRGLKKIINKMKCR